MSHLPPHLRSPVQAALVLLLLATRGLAATSLDEAYLAVVQLPSHGASGTIIGTSPGETVVLTVAHAFEGPARTRPLVMLVPCPEGAGTEKKAGVRLMALNVRADLALVVLGAGPLPHTARVAPAGSIRRSTWAYSCGYDGMRLPSTWNRTRVQGSQGQTTFTEQTPTPGRSGGALFDAKTGHLVGVVQGYTLERPSVGLYASLSSIHAFLDRHGYNRLIDGAAPSSPLAASRPALPGQGGPPVPGHRCPE